MRRKVKRTVWTCIPALCLVVGTGCPPPPPSDGDETKPPPGCKYTTGESRQNFGENPIPAGFFDFDGRSCEPFGGVISYIGQGSDESKSGAADTIVKRDGNPISSSDPVGTEGMVDIVIVALAMASTEPIAVLCDGEPTEWNVSVDLSEIPPPTGTLSVTKEHANGGSAKSTLFVYPRLTFTHLEDPSIVRVFDMAAEGLEPVQFDATFPWSQALDSQDPDAGTAFLVGVDDPLGVPKQRTAGIANPTTPQGVTTRCIQHISPTGDHVYKACAMGSDGG